jgi:FixJ family two-component response regulator
MNVEQLVCVVEDDQAVRSLFRLVIESAGLRTLAFETAEEFLGTAESVSVDCLILDYDLPGMTGLDLLGRLGSRNAALPVLLTSGSDDPSLPVRAKEAGARAYLPKTELSDPRRLIGWIRAALRERAECCVGRLEERG